MSRVRVAILASGRGSNAQALIDAAQAPDYPAEIAAVITNRPGAGVLDRAAAAGIPSATVDHAMFATRAMFESALGEEIAARKIDMIALAGFMRVLRPAFVERWAGRLINIHPSLLPLFPGLNTHARALEAGVKVHGCTVHFVTAGVDEGPIIGQAALPVLPGDTADSLAARVLACEHVLYPRCLALVARGEAPLYAGKVRLPAGDSPQPAALLNPWQAD